MTDQTRAALRGLFARHPQSVPALLAEVEAGGPTLTPGRTISPAVRQWPYMAPGTRDVTPCEGGCLIAFVAAGGVRGKPVQDVWDAAVKSSDIRDPVLMQWFDRTERGAVLAELRAECRAFLGLAETVA